MTFLTRIISAIAFATLLSGCLTTVPSVETERSGNAQTRAKIARGIQSPKIDANGFLVTPWIRSAMMSAFAIRAAQLGLQIDPNGVPVTIQITGVRSKSDAARIAFNFLGGAEWVSGTVRVEDASFNVQEDTWLYWMPTGYRTIQEVAVAVGTQVANGVALIAGMPLDD